jgi:phosphatidylglycerol:prolipoprotein diacylglycerol transferase
MTAGWMSTPLGSGLDQAIATPATGRRPARSTRLHPVPLAVIAFDFDPYLRFGDRALSLETLGVAVAIFVAIVAAAFLAGRTRVVTGPGGADGEDRAAVAGATDAAGGEPAGGPRHLRRDDLLFIVVGIVPGAVAGGRLGYVLIHLDYYTANPSAILDPTQGALQLSLAVVGGALTGALVAGLLDGRIGSWLRVAVVPMLGAIALGKLAMALGGSGQGEAWSGDAATAYLGAGPWGSLVPAVPAYPSQLIEAGLTAIVLVLAATALGSGRLARPDGRAFLAFLAVWSGARFAAAFTWRDPVVLGPLRADQVISLAIVAGCCLVAAAAVWRARRASVAGAAAATADRSNLDRPDPAMPPGL